MNLNLQHIELVSTPSTSAWFGWALLALLVLFTLIVYSAPSFVTEKYKSIFRTIDHRAFSTVSAQVNGNTMVYASLFTILSWTLTFYVLFYPEGSFSLVHYLLFMLSFVMMISLKAGLIWILCYTFGGKNTYSELVPTYASIMLTTGIPLTGGIIAYTIIGPGFMSALVCFILAIINFFSAVFFTFYEHFRQGWLSYVYLLVYLFIVELTPLVAILNLMKLII